LALSEEGARRSFASDVAEQIVAVPYARLVTEQGGKCTSERVEGGEYTFGDEKVLRPSQQYYSALDRRLPRLQ